MPVGEESPDMDDLLKPVFESLKESHQVPGL